MRLSLPLPRNVAVTGHNELLLLELTEPLAPDRLQQRLDDTLPVGLDIHKLFYVAPSGSSVPVWASYRLTLGNSADLVALSRRIEQFLNAEQWNIHRPARKRHPARTFDLRPDITQLSLENNTIMCTITVGNGPTARIDELIAALQIDVHGIVRHIDRIDVGYPLEISRLEHDIKTSHKTKKPCPPIEAEYQ